MLDSYARTLIDAPLNAVGRRVAACGLGANTITFMGFLLGLGAMTFVAFGYSLMAILFFSLNRLMDGIDGAVARQTGQTDFGGFLDIVCDFIIYSGIVFAFCVINSENAFAAAFLIFSFVGPIASFLAYAIISAKNDITTIKRGQKSFYYLGGICEGTETAVVLLLMCLFPEYFTMFCLIYGVLCWVTTFGRAYRAFIDFGDPGSYQGSWGDTICTEPAKGIKSRGQRRL
ncbi:MAG: CDP-alcohol phosphatidyltransferase family protein [Alphaproteobacteria bacterium]|nr:CDP-alcohol phosphatidyltransferase family protein [Alphaproteobacteria bacterium]